MKRFYLIPIDVVPQGNGVARGPKYLKSRFATGIDCPWGGMDYGFTNYMLVVADMAQVDHDAIILNSDVFLFPVDLDTPVDDPTVDVFFDDINIPADWLTPSTSWRELLRQLAGMFQFNQRYGGISGGVSIFDTATLDTRLRQMTVQEQAWFQETVDTFTLQFGLDPIIVPITNRLRQLMISAGSFWDGTPFYLGGVEF